MKFEYVSYLPGGFYQRPNVPAPGFYTRLVPTAHYALKATPKDSGCLLALWAVTALRFDVVQEAECLVGSVSMPAELDLGKNGRFAVVYESPLRLLKWWRDKLDFILDWELFLQTREFSCYMNVPHGNALAASLNWFVASAKCQPGGLSHELGGLDKSHEEDKEPGGKRGMDMTAIESASHLKEGMLKIESLMQALNLPGMKEAVVSSKPVAGADGFLDRHRDLLRRFRLLLMPYAGRVSALADKFVNTTDAQLGVVLADMHGALVRVSFPDIFTAERDIEDMRARDAREERERRAKEKRG